MRPARLQCIESAYRAHVARVDIDPDTRRVLVMMRDGTSLLWDDGARKSFAQKLRQPDLEDQLSIPYPLERSTPPRVDEDPGRIRVQALLAAVYGRTARDVRRNLTRVDWMPRRGGRRLLFNRQNGAAAALRRVSARLEALDRRLARYVVKTGGTYAWRTIAGTDRRSAHSYGIAIDIDPRRSDYWRWHRGKPVLEYRNRIPLQIVRIFESEGFIWGGRWYHFDTMHFEYRPELLHPACAAR